VAEQAASGAAPSRDKKDLTPNEAYAALAGVAPTTHVALGRDDYIGLLPVAWRSIQPYGINFEGLHYDSRELHPLRGVSSGLPEPARGRWEIRYDPYRLQSVFLRDHRQGRWIEAEWTLSRRALAPFSLDVLRAARKAVDRRDETAPAVDVLAEINRIQTSGANTTRERKAAKRDSVNTPVVPPLVVVADTTEDVDAVDTDPSSTISRPRQRRAARRIDIDEEH
jgi:hypothetical protein